MPQVELYVSEHCLYCRWAKDLLKRKGASFKEIDISDDPDLRKAMIERAGGRRTVPQIFIGDKHVGGYTDLAELDSKGELDGWLGR
jgi:glutaredoxin 3